MKENNEIMNEKKELIKNKLLNRDFESLLDIIREVNSYDGELEEYNLYDNDKYFFEDYFYDNAEEAVRATQYGEYNYNDEYVLFNGYGNLDSYTTEGARKLIYDDIEYIAEIITEDVMGEKNYDLSFYDKL